VCGKCGRRLLRSRASENYVDPKHHHRVIAALHAKVTKSGDLAFRLKGDEKEAEEHAQVILS